jgi:hypothetical protein
VNCIVHKWSIHLVYGGGVSSSESVTLLSFLNRGRPRDATTEWEGDSSTEGKNRLRRGRLVYGWGDSSTEGETRLRRGRLI